MSYLLLVAGIITAVISSQNPSQILFAGVLVITSGLYEIAEAIKHKENDK